MGLVQASHRLKKIIRLLVHLLVAHDLADNDYHMPHTSSILLVEDTEATQIMVKSALVEIGKLIVVGTIAEAFTAIQERSFDLILLDVNLPDGEGFDFFVKVRELEQNRLTPILFLTSRQEQADKIRGFSLGADDYIVKPFDLLEFKMRIIAKLKNIALKKNHSGPLSVGPFQINVVAQEILLKGQELSLTGNQFKVLFYLLRNLDKVVTRDELLDEIWGDHVHITDRTVDTHIYSIRQCLGDAAACLQSVHRKGYRFSLQPPQAQKKRAS